MTTLRLNGAHSPAGEINALILDTCGGSVEQINLYSKTCDKTVSLLLTESEIESAPENASECYSKWFNGRVMLPFNDRIPNGKFRWGDKNYQLEINDPNSPDAIHGFLYKLKMNELKNVWNENEHILEIGGVLNSSNGYPFSINTVLTYTLRVNEFVIKIEAENVGFETAPFACGWHPYFKTPVCDKTDEIIDTTQLLLPSQEFVEVNESLLPSGKMGAVKGTMFDFNNPASIGQLEMDLGYVSNGSGVILSHTKGYSIEINAGGIFSFWQVFIPPGRKAIAVEPVSAATNSFNIDGLGRIHLKPGEKVSGRCRISIS
jgi:aldose 1-epimerase